MGKMGLAGASLAAAIPGGALFFVLLMAVLSNLAPMPMIMKITVLLLLLISLIMTIFPGYILVWHRGSRVTVTRQQPDAVDYSGVPDSENVVAGDAGLRDSFLEGFGPDEQELPDDELGDVAFEQEDAFQADEALDEAEVFESASDDSLVGVDTMDLFEYDDPESHSHDTLEISQEDFDADEPLAAGGPAEEDFDFELFDEDEEQKS